MSNEWLENLLSNLNAAETLPALVNESGSGGKSMTFLEVSPPENVTAQDFSNASSQPQPEVNQYTQATVKDSAECVLDDSEILTRSVISIKDILRISNNS